MKICEYVTDNSLKNPLYKFHYVLYEEEQHYTPKEFFDNINNKDNSVEIEWLIKNIQAHFYKLVNTILNILELQRLKKEKINLNIDIELTIVNLLEYFYIKKSTIIDLLDTFYIKFFTESSITKKKLVESITTEMDEFFNINTEVFTSYRNLHKDEILKVRDRIIHNEGYSIKGFVVDDELLFQVYNSELNEQIYPNKLYSYYSKNELEYKAPLIKVTDYMVSHLCNLFKYMDLYLEFLLSKKGFDINTLDSFYESFINSSKYITYMKNDLSLLENKFEELDAKLAST